jgi:hypothetical protein
MKSLEELINEGNIGCASCLSGGQLSDRQKERLVTAMISNVQISPSVKEQIDEIALVERKK